MVYPYSRIDKYPEECHVCPSCGADGCDALTVLPPQIRFKDNDNFSGVVIEPAWCSKCGTMFQREYLFDFTSKRMLNSESVDIFTSVCPVCGNKHLKVSLNSTGEDSDGKYENWRAECTYCHSHSADMDDPNSAIDALSINGPYHNALTGADHG